MFAGVLSPTSGAAPSSVADSKRWANLDELLWRGRSGGWCPPLRSVVLSGHKAPVLAMEALDGRVVSGDASGVVYCWETAGKCRCAHEMRSFKGAISALRLLPGVVVAASSDSSLRSARFPADSKPKGKLKTQRLRRHKAEVLCVDAWQGAGATAKTQPLVVLSGGADDTAVVWNGLTGKAQHTFTHHSEAVLCVSLTPDGSHGVTGSQDSTVGYLDVAKGAVVGTLRGHSGPVVCCHSANDRIVTGSTDGLIKVWDPRQRRVAMTLSGHVSPVWCLRMASADDSTVISGAEDGLVKVWDLRSAFGGSKLSLHGHTKCVTALDFDWTKIVSGSVDSSVRLFDLNTGRPLSVCTGHTGTVSAVCLQDTFVASASSDGTVRCWFG